MSGSYLCSNDREILNNALYRAYIIWRPNNSSRLGGDDVHLCLGSDMVKPAKAWISNLSLVQLISHSSYKNLISVSSTLLSAIIKSSCPKASWWIVLLNVLADLSLEPLPPLLQLLNGTVLWKLIRSTAHLALSQTPWQQLLAHMYTQTNTRIHMYTCILYKQTRL